LNSGLLIPYSLAESSASTDMPLWVEVTVILRWATLLGCQAVTCTISLMTTTSDFFLHCCRCLPCWLSCRCWLKLSHCWHTLVTIVNCAPDWHRYVVLIILHNTSPCTRLCILVLFLWRPLRFFAICKCFNPIIAGCAYYYQWLCQLCLMIWPCWQALVLSFWHSIFEKLSQMVLKMDGKAFKKESKCYIFKWVYCYKIEWYRKMKLYYGMRAKMCASIWGWKRMWLLDGIWAKGAQVSEDKKMWLLSD
jgi:hypothetical protein